MKLLVVMSFVCVSLNVFSSETSVLNIKLPTSESRVQIESVNFDSRSDSNLVLSEIKNLADKIDTVARGDKEGNGGHYLIAQFAQELFINANTLSPELLPYFSSIIKSTSIVKAQNFCVALTSELILVDESCLDSLIAINHIDVIINFIIDNLGMYSVLASSDLVKTTFCKTTQSSILKLQYPSDYLRIYLLDFLGSSRYFETNFHISSVDQYLNPIVLTKSVLRDSFGKEVCAKYTDNFTYYNSKCWERATGEQRLILVFHEILRSFKIDDDDYFQTISFLNYANCSNYWGEFSFLDR